MATKGLDVSLTLDKSSVRRTRKAFVPYLRVPQAIFGGKVLQDLILERTRKRFDKAGTSPVAQKTPRYQKWRPLAPATLRSGGTQNRKLYRTGDLRGSIQIIKDTLDNVFYTNTGAGFRVGVKRGSAAEEYAAIQNFGGKSGVGGKSVIPARRYIGIGRPDKLAVTALMKKIAKQEGI